MTPRPCFAALAAAALVALGAPVAWAHYPMLEIAGDGMVDPREELHIDLSYGHPFMDDRHPTPHGPGTMGVAAAGGRVRDVTARITSLTGTQPPRWRLSYTPRRSGDYVFGWSCGLFGEEPQRKVEDFAKVVVHVRDEDGAQVGWSRSLGHAMEILPLTRPYALPVGVAFRGRVVRQTQEKRGALVKTTATPQVGLIVEAESHARVRGRSAYLPFARQSVRTGEDGTFVVTLPRSGWWLISCATDGGAGEQGSSPLVQYRAVLWVYVGGTVWDEPDPEEAFGRRLAETRRSVELSGSFEQVTAQLAAQLGFAIEIEHLPREREVSLQSADASVVQLFDRLVAQVGGAWRHSGGSVLFFKP